MKPRSDKTRTYHGAILALVLVCVALVVHEVYGEHGYLAVRQQKREYNALQQKIRRLQEENQQLERYVDALKTDPKTIERIAREKIHMARPKEFIYTLPEKTPRPNDSASAENGKPKF